MAEKRLLQKIINHLNYCLNVKGCDDKIHIGTCLFGNECRVKIDGYFFVFHITNEYVDDDNGSFCCNKFCNVSIYKDMDIESGLNALERGIFYDRDWNGVRMYEYRFPVLSSEINVLFYKSVINTFIKEKRDDFIKKYTS